MPKDFVLDWNGDDLLENTLAAAKAAVDETTVEAAAIMGVDAPRDTGLLAGSFTIEAAERKGDDVEGKVGADASVYYALPVEVNHPSKAGFMRRAGDRAFPNLAGRIGKGIK